MVANREFSGHAAGRAVVADAPIADFSAAFDQPGGQDLIFRFAVLHRGNRNELILDGGGTGVNYQYATGHESFTCWAWIAVMATVLTMSWTSAPRERSLTGRRRPCRTGPTATAPAVRCTALYVLFPVFRSGKINTVACPATADSGSLALATETSTAASY